jgi:5-methyltetrahydropteroyltriglutamate--homocysteine methyltransferase
MANIFTGEDRILTTHAGALPRPPAFIDLMKAKAEVDYDPQTYAAQVSAAVEACVRKQAESGIDIVADGEEKTGFSLYIQDRLAGLEPRPQGECEGFRREDSLLLEDFEQCLQAAIQKGTAVSRMPVVCSGSIEYVGLEQLQRDIKNLSAAAAKVECSAVFMPSLAPGGVGDNEFYSSEEEFLFASGEALRAEYKAIVDAGFILQIDDPFLPAVFTDPCRTRRQADRQAQAYVEALNHSLRGIPPEKIRYHIYWSGHDGARRCVVPFVDVARHMLRVNSAAYSFEASKVRYEDDADLWEAVRFPDGKVIIPGMIAHSGDRVEDPQEIAERLVRFTQRVGRDNVVASIDNGASCGALARPEIDPAVNWSRFEALREGAELASHKLWARRPSPRRANARTQ